MTTIKELSASIKSLADDIQQIAAGVSDPPTDHELDESDLREWMENADQALNKLHEKGMKLEKLL